jgi:hypothetical protein
LVAEGPLLACVELIAFLVTRTPRRGVVKEIPNSEESEEIDENLKFSFLPT